MRAFHRSAKILIATAAVAAAIPVAVILGQTAGQTDKVPSAPTPLHAPMTPLTAAEIAARQARGGGGAPADYNVSRRSDFDKALPNPYAVNQTWYTMPKGRFLGGASGIDTDRDGVSIWVAERCGGANACNGSKVDPVIKFGPDGKILTMFGSGMINYPHGLWVDLDDNIWVTDLQSNLPQPGAPARGGAGGGRGGAGAGRGGAAAGAARGAAAAPARGAATAVAPAAPLTPLGAQVLKFSPTGKLLLRLGTPGVYGTDETHFSQPSDVVTAPNGDIFVADGHDSLPANNRIVKFDKTGKYIKSWSTCQPWQERQIDCSHSIEIDSQGRLFVGNRGNNVIDIFDQDGKLLAEWAHFGKPTGLKIDRNDILYVSDSQTGIGNGNSFVKGVHVGSAKTGVVTAFLPDPLGNSSPWSGPGTLSPEGVTADKNGRIITSSVRPPGLMLWTLQFNTAVPSGAQGGGRGGAVE